MHIGPVQLIVVGFDNDDNFRGQIKRELEDIRGHGVIKLIDILFAHKDDDGALTIIRDSDATQDDLARYGAALQRLLNVDGNGDAAAAMQATTEGLLGISASDLHTIVMQIPPGTALAIVLFEHVWAAGLAAAIRDAGGHLVAQGILTRDAVMLMGQELDAMAEAEAAITVAEAIKGAALLDALAFTAEMDDIKQAAVDAVLSSDVTTILAAQTLRTLMSVGVVDDTEIEPALVALIEAGLLNPALVAQGLAAAAEAEAEIADLVAAQAAFNGGQNI